MWIRIGAVALCFPGPGKRRHPVEEGCVCVHRARQSSGCAWGLWPQQREARHGEGSHTQKKKDRERETERMRAGESGEGERENTSWRFILLLCNHQWHSLPDPLLSQTNKRPCIPM